MTHRKSCWQRHKVECKNFMALKKKNRCALLQQKHGRAVRLVTLVCASRIRLYILPLGERKSYSGTLNAGSEPRPTSETTEAITALSITMEVVFVSDNDDSAGDGHNTDSIAKKQPATAALNPV